MDEIKPDISRKEKFGQRMKEKYPDKDFADDEALFSQIDDDYTDYDNRIKEHETNTKRLTDLFAKDHRAARFLTDMAKGQNPWVAIVKQLGIDGITDIFENPEYEEDLAKAQDEYLDKLAQSADLENQYHDNIGESIEMLKSLQEEQGIDDDSLDKAIEFIVGLASDAMLGKFSRESVEMALKAINYESDMKQASVEGEVRGRNANILAQKRKAPTKTDGVPSLAGANTSAVKNKAQNIFDLAKEAN